MGGAVPGSTWGQATELFQEGLLLPPVKIVRSGTANTDLERLIASNSRAAELVLGDMRAQIGVTRIGRNGVKALCHRFKTDNFISAMDEIIEASGRQFRAAIKSLPDGECTSEGLLDGDGIERDQCIYMCTSASTKANCTSISAALPSRPKGPPI